MLMGVLGVLHSVASVSAMVLGGIVLAGPKGTARHRALGRIYVLAMIFLSITSLGIFRSHGFWFPHWLSLATIFVVALAWCAAHYRWPTQSAWRYVHLSAMLVSYYFLWGGAVNEAFLHVAPLHDLAPRLKGIAVGALQSFVMLVFLVWILCANAFMAGRRSKEVAA